MEHFRWRSGACFALASGCLWTGSTLSSQPALPCRPCFQASRRRAWACVLLHPASGSAGWGAVPAFPALCWGCVTDVYTAPGFRGGLSTFSRTRGVLRTLPSGGPWLAGCTFFLSGSILQHAAAGILFTPKYFVCGFKVSGRLLALPCVVGDIPAQGGLSGTLPLRPRRLCWSRHPGQAEACPAEGAACGKGQQVGVVGAVAPRLLINEGEVTPL